MNVNISKLSYGAMKGFGLGLVLSVLFNVTTVSSVPLTVVTIFTSPFVIVFIILGLGLSFEDVDAQVQQENAPVKSAG